MAHTPEQVNQYVCENCQVVHAGTPIDKDPGAHAWEPPANCGACGASTFVEMANWSRHHD